MKWKLATRDYFKVIKNVQFDIFHIKTIFKNSSNIMNA